MVTHPKSYNLYIKNMVYESDLSQIRQLSEKENLVILRTKKSSSLWFIITYPKSFNLNARQYFINLHPFGLFTHPCQLPCTPPGKWNRFGGLELEGGLAKGGGFRNCGIYPGGASM